MKNCCCPYSPEPINLPPYQNTKAKMRNCEACDMAKKSDDKITDFKLLRSASMS